MVGDWTRRTVEAMGGMGSVWQVPQAHDWANYQQAEAERAASRAPTLEEMRNMTLQCLAEGAMGLVYYSFYDLQRDRLGFEARWADMRTIAAEVRQLIPYVLSTDELSKLSVRLRGPDAVRWRFWRLVDQIALVAANPSDQSAELEWGVVRLTDGRVTQRFLAPSRGAEPRSVAPPELLFGEASVLEPGRCVLAPGQSLAIRMDLRAESVVGSLQP